MACNLYIIRRFFYNAGKFIFIGKTLQEELSGIYVNYVAITESLWRNAPVSTAETAVDDAKQLCANAIQK